MAVGGASIVALVDGVVEPDRVSNTLFTSRSLAYASTSERSVPTLERRIHSRYEALGMEGANMCDTAATRSLIFNCLSIAVRFNQFSNISTQSGKHYACSLWLTT